MAETGPLSDRNGITESEKDINQDAMTVFLFRVSGNLFGLDSADIIEVVHIPELLTPPGRPSFITGFINLSGQAIPVINTSILLGFTEQQTNLYTPIIIIKGKTFPIALLVETAHVLEIIKNNNIHPLDDESIFNKCVTFWGISTGGETFHLLSPAKIMLEQEHQLTDEFQKMTQKRLDELEKEVA